MNMARHHKRDTWRNEPVGSSVYTFQQRWPRSSKSYRHGQIFRKAGWFDRHLNYFLQNIPRSFPSKGPSLGNESREMLVSKVDPRARRGTTEFVLAEPLGRQTSR